MGVGFFVSSAAALLPRDLDWRAAAAGGGVAAAAAPKGKFKKLGCEVLTQAVVR